MTQEEMERADTLCRSKVDPETGTFLHARERYRSPAPFSACLACREAIMRDREWERAP